MENTWIERRRNYILNGKDKKFWISYNPKAGLNGETALCQDPIIPGYLILKGDYRKDFEPLVEKGYEACLKKFNELLKAGATKSFWSE